MKKLNFDLLTPTAGSWEGGGDGAAGKTQLLAFCYIRDSLQINIQHDHALKKLNFDLLTPPPESGGGVVVCWQNICYRVAAVIISFKLLYNMAF